MSDVIVPERQQKPPERDESFIVVPKPMVLAAGLMMLCAIGLAAFAQISRQGRVERPASSIAVERAVIFQQLPDDVVRVLDGTTRAVIISYPPGQGGFVRGSLRAFAYTRKVRGIGLDEKPFTLTAWANGTLTLDDPFTGGRVELDAFGSENRAAFAALLRR